MGYEQFKILVVDNERAQVDATVRQLKKKGASAVGATTIEDAQTKIKEDTFNIAIVDLNFDIKKQKGVETAGFQILDYLKKDSPTTYRIVRSVYNEADVYSKIFGYHGYAHRYCRKSALGDLDRILDEYIKETEVAEKKDSVSCGELSYDRDKKIFYLFEQPIEDIDLTSAQIHLLIYLLENQRYMSKREIYDYLERRGDTRSNDSDESVVAVHINAIRKQFKKLGYEGFIKTRNSIGYRIVPGTHVRVSREEEL